jgi:transglutaminase-like putative cysteine protease
MPLFAPRTIRYLFKTIKPAAYLGGPTGSGLDRETGQFPLKGASAIDRNGFCERDVGQHGFDCALVRISMQIRLGYELIYDCPQPTPMMLMLNLHYTRVSDLVVPDHLIISPSVPIRAYRDGFGNWCSRIVAPTGRTRLSANAIVNDTGEPDVVATEAHQHAVEDLPNETLVFLLGSRYCETDRLSEIAWSLFEKTPPGWGRVQAICDYVHQHIAFGYEHARATRTAWEASCDRTGVCRDFAHLAVAFCRCMNIPARYCTGYLGDIGVPVSDAPMDFAAWFEAYVGGRWYTFDARNNIPRIGRVLIARGRDAADVAISTTFGPNTLSSFSVLTEEVAAT